MAKGSVPPISSTNKEGDTRKVNRKPILLNWQLKTTVREKDPTTKKWVRQPSNRNSVTGDSLLYYTEALLDWFEIPAFTGAMPEAKNKRIIVSAHTRTIFKGIDDTTGTPIQVPEFEQARGQGTGGRKNRNARVNLGENRITNKGNPRTVIFGFPPFFTIPMIAQAIGSMIRTTNDGRKPSIFQMVDSGASYKIPYNTAAAPLDGWDSGAWIGTAFLPEDSDQAQGGDNITGNDNVVSSAGDMDSSNNTTTP